MSLSEFELINKYFKDAFNDSPDVKCGIGDDAAIVALPAGMELAISVDTLVAGIHFTVDAGPEDIGYKSLAVNLSDMAAMGAVPQWITLSLTMPENDEYWLKSFMSGFSVLAKQYSLSLVGGDLTHGPLSITVQIHGFVPEGQALYRHGAESGDLIYVSGTLGDAGLALQLLENRLNVSENHRDYLLQRLYRPVPRVELGMALRGIASSVIDISDGLLADLNHILVPSHKGAKVFLDKLPKSEAVCQLADDTATELALAAGDDYELCFTVPTENQSLLESKLSSDTLTCIGQITKQSGIRWLRSDGSEFKPSGRAYRHF